MAPIDNEGEGGNMASANGQGIKVTRSNGETFDLTASWRAPFFVLEDDGEGKPGLFHAETFADAERRATFGGWILDKDFVPVGKGPKHYEL